jgi:hypothetical protein
LERYVNGKAVAPPEEIDEKKSDVNNGAPVKVSNPAYEEWFAMDQQVLGFLLTSLRNGWDIIKINEVAIKKQNS